MTWTVPASSAMPVRIGFHVCAVVGGHENVDAEVVAAMAVERRVGGAFVEARGDDAADVRPLRHASDVGTFFHVLPPSRVTCRLPSSVPA